MVNNNNTLTNLETFDFHGDQVYLIVYNGEPYIPVKPISDNMGLVWSAQFEKLKENEEDWGIRIIRIPSKSGTQKKVCIPLKKLPAYLYTINVKKVKPELQDRIKL